MEHARARRRLQLGGDRYTAKVKYNGVERVMATAQMSGDCNGCHTQTGTQGAPGRILLP